MLRHSYYAGKQAVSERLGVVVQIRAGGVDQGVDPPLTPAARPAAIIKEGMTRSLEALLRNMIDYAGLYPPAALPLPEVIGNYRSYLASPESWMLNRLVLPMGKLADAPLESNWRVTLLVDEEPGPLPPQVETLETRAPRRFSLPTYCEAPLDRIADAFAKVRTGGLTPDAVPPSGQLAGFLCEAAARRLPFKATAGLHHPIRAEMHGFINVFLAAAFAWQGTEREMIVDILEEREPGAFEFLDGEMRWRGRSLSAAQVAAARREFAHSFGSCSFEEPLSDLRRLGWLP